jgi:hypothetical protein
MLTTEIMQPDTNSAYLVGSPERRRAQRICVPFPAKVSGIDKDGRPFEVRTVLDNVSRTGLFLRMMPCVEAGASLSVTFQLIHPTGLTEGTAGVRVREARVVRAEEKPGGVCGVAITFERSEFV